MDSVSDWPITQASVKLASGTVYETSNNGEFLIFAPDAIVVEVSKTGYITQSVMVSPDDVIIELVAIGKCYTQLLFTWVILSHSHCIPLLYS